MRSTWRIETMVLTQPNKDTFNRLACQQLHLNHAVIKYIKLEKHKLDQIAERNIRISLDKLYSFLEVKLLRLWRKRYEGKYDISSVLSNSSNLTLSQLQRCQNPQNNMHADNSANHVDLCQTSKNFPWHGLTAQLFLKFLLTTQHEVP